MNDLQTDDQQTGLGKHPERLGSVFALGKLEVVGAGLQSLLWVLGVDFSGGLRNWLIVDEVSALLEVTERDSVFVLDPLPVGLGPLGKLVGVGFFFLDFLFLNGRFLNFLGLFFGDGF